MFGFLKTKPINEELLTENVSDAILKIWLDDSNLKYQGFDSFITIAQAGGKEVKPIHFLTEKLRFITSIAIISLSRAGVQESTIQRVINLVKTQVTNTGVENRGASAALGLKAKEYAQVRFSAAPNKAGKIIESRFSQAAFGYTPSDNDTNPRYTLYKSLSSFERTTIFEVGSAIRKSRE